MVGIARCRCFTGEKWYTEGALCHVVGRFVDKNDMFKTCCCTKKRVKDVSHVINNMLKVLR